MIGQPDIVIVIDGGNLQAVVSTGERITYRLVDLDNIRDGDRVPLGESYPVDSEHVDADAYTRDWTAGITREDF